MTTLLVLLALGAVVLVAACVGQRRLLYFPEREELAAATRRARALGLEPWRDGDALLGWRTPAPAGAASPPRILFFHGNAGSALDRVAALATLRAAPPGGAEVFLAEYPGYGPRPGSPAQDAIVADALRALEAARRDARGPVLLAGESLGAAVVVLATARAPDRVDGLLLVTPLTSVVEVARRHYGALAARLVRDTWRADAALAAYHGPVAIVVAGRDEITFPDLGRALHDGYAGPKWLWVDPTATHNTVDWRSENPRWRDAFAFLLAGAG